MVGWRRYFRGYVQEETCRENEQVPFQEPRRLLLLRELWKKYEVRLTNSLTFISSNSLRAYRNWTVWTQAVSTPTCKAQVIDVWYALERIHWLPAKKVHRGWMYESDVRSDTAAASSEQRAPRGHVMSCRRSVYKAGQHLWGMLSHSLVRRHTHAHTHREREALKSSNTTPSAAAAVCQRCAVLIRVEAAWCTPLSFRTLVNY